MLPKWHILFGFIFSFIIFIYFDLTLVSFLIIFLSSVLIDVDHYLYYVYKKKDLSLKRAYKWFLKLEKKINSFPIKKRRDYWLAFCILHSIELISILLFLGIIFNLNFLRFIAIGFLFHISLDIIFMLHDSPYNTLTVVSLIYQIYELKTKKDFGNHI